MWVCVGGMGRGVYYWDGRGVGVDDLSMSHWTESFHLPFTYHLVYRRPQF